MRSTPVCTLNTVSKPDAEDQQREQGGDREGRQCGGGDGGRGPDGDRREEEPDAQRAAVADGRSKGSVFLDVTWRHEALPAA